MNSVKETHFYKDCKWSPDGSSLLTNNNDNILRIYSSQLEQWLSIKHGEPIYDMCWYPYATSTDIASFCFVASSKDHPIHLYNCDGSVRCSFVAHNHLDQLSSSIALAFDSTAQFMYGGVENAIHIYDLQRPGPFVDIIKTTETRKSKDGQKGIVSCLDIGHGMIVAGSYGNSIGIYEEASGKAITLFQTRAGVTQVTLSEDGVYLYAGFRKYSDILCWDLRNMEIASQLPRGCETNQRISFDIHPQEKLVITGNTDGKVKEFDLATFELRQERKVSTSAVGAVRYNPAMPTFIAACTGNRTFADDSPSENNLHLFSFD